MYEQFFKTWQAPQMGLWNNPWQSMGSVGGPALQQTMAMQRQWIDQFAGLIRLNDTARHLTLDLVQSTSKLYLASLERQTGWWRNWSDLLAPAGDTPEATPSKAKPAARKPKAEVAQAQIQLEVVASRPAPEAVEDTSDPLDWDGHDDLKQINGIGPGLEKKLNAEGIFSFRQVAEFTASDIARLEKTVIKFPGRIKRDGWVAQAKKLAAAH